MQTLDAVLTYDTALRAYLDSLDYRSPASTTKAEAVLANGYKLMALRPQLVQVGGVSGERTQFTDQSILSAIQAAEKWLRSYRTVTTEPQVGYLDLTRVIE